MGEVLRGACSARQAEQSRHRRSAETHRVSSVRPGKRHSSPPGTQRYRARTPWRCPLGRFTRGISAFCEQRPIFHKLIKSVRHAVSDCFRPLPKHLLNCRRPDAKVDVPVLSVRVKTRLYSPLGLGTALDLAYNHHILPQSHSFRTVSSLLVRSRTIQDCDPRNPAKSSVVRLTAYGYIEEPLPGTSEVLRVVRLTHWYLRMTRSLGAEGRYRHLPCRSTGVARAGDGALRHFVLAITAEGPAAGDHGGHGWRALAGELVVHKSE